MMGPTDPMQYIPTWQLFIILILTFGAIYGCGRILEYLLRQFLRCMKYLLLGIIDLLYGDDYEENVSNSSTIEDVNKRRKREAAHRIKKAAEIANNNASTRSAFLSNGTSESTLLGKATNGTIERTTVPVETTMLEVDIDEENDSEIAEAMRHSPTDDEEKSKNSSSSVSPAIRHRHGENVKHSEQQLPEPSSGNTVLSSS